ncbi:hypothetical protein [Lacrimispora brassicae]
MEQLEKLEVYIEDYCSKRMEQKKKLLKTNRTQLNRLFCEVLDAAINHQTEKQLFDEQERVRYLFLCQLASSRQTESYKVLLGMSNSNLYLDDSKVTVFWYPEPIYQSVKVDMKEVKKLLKEKGEQPEEEVILKLKQKLLEDDWNLLREQFPEMIEENFYRITESNLRIEEHFSALCGDYMERLPVVWDKIVV